MPFICHSELMLCIRSPWIGHLHLYRCFPMTLFFGDLGDPVWGALSAAYSSRSTLAWVSLLPRPPFQTSSPPLPFLLLILLSCSGHRLSSSGPLLSNNVCIHAPMETPTDPQKHSHTHINTFCGLPQSEALKHICLTLLSNNKHDRFPACGLAAESFTPRVHVSTYRH